MDPNLYFYRDGQGKEVDVIYQRGREFILIEVKSSRIYNGSFLETLSLFQLRAKERDPRSFLIYRGAEGQVQTVTLLPWQRAAEALVGH